MRLTMKKLILLTLLGASCLTQAAQAETIFSCKTTNNKYIEVKKVNNNFYEYKFGSASKNEITIRNKTSELLGRSSRWDGFGSGRWSTISFQNGEYLYHVTVYFDTNSQTESSGVAVERRGKRIAEIACTPQTAQANFNDDNFSW